eukprot:TRINITY_DN42460_c0_g2_i2.p1 TRINITY_DN42460_c0_g2~~TRINITY_DN42460_c0_g2_i2.p1  ORF type:complete len:282 (+),score=57.65 TRINITY_DN42460_c0_g2_i2:109-846(+)
MSEKTKGTFKSIMEPATFLGQLIYRPLEARPTSKSMFKTARRRSAADADIRTGLSPVSVSESKPQPVPDSTTKSAKKHGTMEELLASVCPMDFRKEKDDESSISKRDEIEQGFPDPETQAEEEKEQEEKHEIRIFIPLPNLDLPLDSHQFWLLIDVLKTVLVVPKQQATPVDENLEERTRNQTLPSLREDAQKIKNERIRCEWEMRHIEWILRDLGEYKDRYLTYEIGRAVQQECRDRSRMPSSA